MRIGATHLPKVRGQTPLRASLAIRSTWQPFVVPKKKVRECYCTIKNKLAGLTKMSDEVKN